jgi:hypothetical protein
MTFKSDADSEAVEKVLHARPDAYAACRRWDRLPIAIPIFVRGLDESGREFIEFSAATNLNAGGMLVISRRRISPGKEISLEIPSASPGLKPAGQESCNCFSATVLYTEFSEGFHLCGVQFSEPILPEPEDDE